MKTISSPNIEPPDLEPSGFKQISNLEKTPKMSCVITRRIVGHEDLNANGSLFGGKIMAWIDEIAFMSARRFAGIPQVVTVNVDNISFVMPMYHGEHVILTAQVNYSGRSSMEIGVKVERENPFSGAREHATSAYLTFVALDASGKPIQVPRLLLENDEDVRRYEEASLRVKVRNRMKAHLKRKLQKPHFPSARKKVDATLQLDFKPNYLLTRKLKVIGANEWSEALDRRVGRVESRIIRSLKLLDFT
ncbi:acyl-CoA thioesterase [bacterium]|nr:acyl-CoA thioesterase [bacterium]